MRSPGLDIPLKRSSKRCCNIIYWWRSKGWCTKTNSGNIDLRIVVYDQDQGSRKIYEDMLKHHLHDSSLKKGMCVNDSLASIL